MKIDPNPSGGRFSVVLDQKVKKGNRVRLMVFNAKGILIYKRSYDGGNNFPVDISDQMSGTYILELIYLKQMLSEQIILKK